MTKRFIVFGHHSLQRMSLQQIYATHSDTNNITADIAIARHCSSGNMARYVIRCQRDTEICEAMVMELVYCAHYLAYPMDVIKIISEERCMEDLTTAYCYRNHVEKMPFFFVKKLNVVE